MPQTGPWLENFNPKLSYEATFDPTLVSDTKFTLTLNTVCDKKISFFIGKKKQSNPKFNLNLNKILPIYQAVKLIRTNVSSRFCFVFVVTRFESQPGLSSINDTMIMYALIFFVINVSTLDYVQKSARWNRL